ncbi:hypothetical protein HDU67_008501 [Dinochytrium kinnereticum]|nr:hypothetical protein HDU67_008501 [Dinochytrium kinnereticum]
MTGTNVMTEEGQGQDHLRGLDPHHQDVKAGKGVVTALGAPESDDDENDDDEDNDSDGRFAQDGLST